MQNDFPIEPEDQPALDFDRIWLGLGQSGGVGDIVPLGWRHPVTGRKSPEIDPALVVAGRHLRRARYMSGFSQDRLAAEAHVTQTHVSRFERALAPAMKVERLVWVAQALHPNFPLGYCPHDHVCAWQRLVPPQVTENTDQARRAEAAARIDALLKQAEASTE